VNNPYVDLGTFILPEHKKAYFISDIHLGLYPYDHSSMRERMVVEWLESIRKDAGILFLAGDIFDFWYEYRKVAPRGFIRFLAKICEFTDNGIPVYFFTGNHDVWVFDYLSAETGVKVFRNPITIAINEKFFFIGHGDGVGPGDSSYKILRHIFHNKLLQFLFSRLHPNLALSLGHSWSKHSRYSKGLSEPFYGKEKEFNVLFAKDYVTTHPVDFFIFGHRHIAMEIPITDTSKLFNLGEWIVSNTYGEFNGNEMRLLSHPAFNNKGKEIRIIRL
jgi:UDP-2,3-diacylglucosamine hydrolase